MPKKLLVIPAAIGFSAYFIWEKYFKDTFPYQHQREVLHEAGTLSTGAAATAAVEPVGPVVFVEENGSGAGAERMVSILDLNRNVMSGFLPYAK